MLICKRNEMNVSETADYFSIFFCYSPFFIYLSSKEKKKQKTMCGIPLTFFRSSVSQITRFLNYPVIDGMLNAKKEKRHKSKRKRIVGYKHEVSLIMELILFLVKKKTINKIIPLLPSTCISTIAHCYQHNQWKYTIYNKTLHLLYSLVHCSWFMCRSVCIEAL